LFHLPVRVSALAHFASAMLRSSSWRGNVEKLTLVPRSLPGLKTNTSTITARISSSSHGPLKDERGASSSDDPGRRTRRGGPSPGFFGGSCGGGPCFGESDCSGRSPDGGDSMRCFFEC